MPLTCVKFKPLSAARSVNQSVAGPSAELSRAGEVEPGDEDPQPRQIAQRQTQNRNRTGGSDLTRRKRPAPERRTGLIVQFGCLAIQRSGDLKSEITKSLDEPIPASHGVRRAAIF